MKEEKNQPNGISRRKFIQGAAIGTVGIASAGFLAGCSSEGANQDASEPKTEQTANWTTPPEPIPESEIKNTIETDIVVVGAGSGGMVAALSAAEAGAKTVLLEKGSKSYAGPMWMAAIDSKLQKSMGVNIDKHEAVAEICRYGGHLADQKLVKLWADKSGEAMDWLTDIVESAGLKMMVETDLKVGYYKSYAVGHVVVPDPTPEIAHLGEYGSPLYIPVLTEKAKQLGIDIKYDTPAVQLIQEAGKVIGVIAGSPDSYTRYNVSKGVILATGGYGRNEEMLNDLCPTAQYCGSSIVPAVASGDGIKMAVWAGGALDPLHGVMVFDRGVMHKDTGTLGAPWSGGYLRTGSQPFLRVNVRGNRFVNEDLPYDYLWDASIMEPENVSWQIWDSNWKEDITRFHTTICSRVVPHPQAPPRDGLDYVEQEHASFIDKGLILKADTIEQLAEQMGVPVNNFKATIDRYNVLAKQGNDEDFGKIDFRLSTIEKGPFFAAKLSGTLLCNINGLRIDTNMQVLDENHNPITGLYAVGNDSGSFFSYNYPQMFGGLALGRTITFGRVAGISVANA
ncbi:fumarate reductase flavoprotein subunit [hydrocarbon metagenome]|uniref:Fumarate reductase flavoprotein subunit n=1 Tax=hydrocarbon metagenome TaxID=938273 RepID=A0A0W8E5Q6_9ZZZZ